MCTGAATHTKIKHSLGTEFHTLLVVGGTPASAATPSLTMAQMEFNSVLQLGAISGAHLL
jgi:hypothetical protein